MSRLPLLALRNVARNRRRSLITAAAVFFGVAAVCSLRGFIEGFTVLMTENAVLGRIGALQVHRKGYMDSLDGMPLDLNMPYSSEWTQRLSRVPGVKGVTGRIQFAGMVTNGKSQTMFVGRGIDPETERKACPLTGHDVAKGHDLAVGDHARALLGTELAESLGRVPGEIPDGKPPLVVLSGSSPEGRLNSLEVEVKGTSASGFALENKRVATLPLALAQELLGLQGKVTEYAVQVENLNQVALVKARLQAELGPEYEVHDWKEIQPILKDVMVRQRFALGLLSSILFVIVLTGIVNTMLMSVYERVREVGTMLAMGVRRRQVLRLFLLEAAALGAWGAVAGTLVAKGVVFVLHKKGLPVPILGNKSSLLRPVLTNEFALWAMGAAVAGALVAALYPAWKASRQDPVEALRSL